MIKPEKKLINNNKKRMVTLWLQHLYEGGLLQQLRHSWTESGQSKGSELGVGSMWDSVSEGAIELLCSKGHVMIPLETTAS